MTDPELLARLQALRAAHRAAWAQHDTTNSAEAQLVEAIRAVGGTVHGLAQDGWHSITTEDERHAGDLFVSQWPEREVTAATAIRPDLGADALALCTVRSRAVQAAGQAQEEAVALVRGWVLDWGKDC